MANRPYNGGLRVHNALTAHRLSDPVYSRVQRHSVQGGTGGADNSVQWRASPHCKVVNLVRSGRKQPQLFSASAGVQARHPLRKATRQNAAALQSAAQPGRAAAVDVLAVSAAAGGGPVGEVAWVPETGLSGNCPCRGLSQVEPSICAEVRELRDRDEGRVPGDAP